MNRGLALAENQFLPGLSLGAGVSQDFGPTSAPLSSSSSVWNPDPKTRALPDLDVSLVFELPVPLSQARGRLATVVASQNRLGHQRQLLLDRVSLELADVDNAASIAVGRLLQARREVDAAVVVEEAERARFAAGDSNLFLVNQREQASAEARQAVIDAVVDGRKAEVARLAATGVLAD